MGKEQGRRAVASHTFKGRPENYSACSCPVSFKREARERAGMPVCPYACLPLMSAPACAPSVCPPSRRLGRVTRALSSVYVKC
eukprot:132113-Chlamydomonas_euryale.AAC.5